MSFASRYTTALEIKATRYERTDLLHSSMHNSDENLLLSFTQEAGVSCEIMASLKWNNSKMSYLFDLSRTKHGPNTVLSDRLKDLTWHENNSNTNAFPSVSKQSKPKEDPFLMNRVKYNQITMK